MFDTPDRLLLGLATGVVFGFLLQKGQAAKFEVIVGQFLLRDSTVVKIMLTAVLVGAVGVHALVDSGQAGLHIKPFLIAGVLGGGALFGLGIVLLGYCPGTTVAACGEGWRDAMVGVLGMLAGAGLFVALYPVLGPLLEQAGNLGMVTIPGLLGVSRWTVVVGIVFLGILGLLGLEWLERGGWQRPALA